jgi:aspartate kinase
MLPRRTPVRVSMSGPPFDLVMKFGGAALADGPGVERACAIVARAARAGARTVVVVSAHRGVTALLEEVARAAAEGRSEADRVRIRHRTILRQLGLDAELLDRYFEKLGGMLSAVEARRRLLPGERDFVLSFGERMCARVVAAAMQASGIAATPVDSFDLGLTTDSNHGQARPLPGVEGAVRTALAQVPGIPVVTGFLAKDSRGNLTTLGRNGSDLTAALIAEAVSAREVEFWKAVGGVMTADPELVPGARVIEQLSWEDAAEYAFHGAEVLHPAALAPARRARVSVRLRDVRAPDAAGTRVGAVAQAAGPIGLACRKQVLRLELELGAPELRGPRLADLFAVLERHRVEPGLISAAGERVGVLVAPGPGVEPALAELRSAAEVRAELAQVALIGRDAGADGGLAARALGILAEACVDVAEAFLGARRCSQAFLVDRADLHRAAGALHAGLVGGTLEPV